MVAVFSKDCDQGEDCDLGRSLFLRIAIMVAILITLKIYAFLGLRHVTLDLDHIAVSLRPF